MKTFFGWAVLSLAVVSGCTESPVIEATTPTASEPTPSQVPTPVSEGKQPPLEKPPTASSEWGKFLGPTGDGKSSETGILTKWPEAGLPIVWQRKLGTSYGICAVAGGKVFQFDRYGDKARLVCLNVTDGTLLWTHEYATEYVDSLGYNNGPRCSPIVDGDRVYIFGAEGMLQCVRVKDGEVVGKVDTEKKFGVVQNFFGVGSTPVVEGDLLLVMVGGSSKRAQQFGRLDLDRVVGADSGVVAFDKLTGEVRYKISSEMASYASIKLATIGERRWAFAFCRGGLIGFEPTWGKIDFHYPWRSRLRDSVNASTPVVVGNEVLISETYGPGSSLLKVRPGGYDIVWKDDDRVREKAMQTHWNTAIHHEGFLYGSSGRHSPNAELRCIEWKTGKVRWSEPGLSRASLLYVDGHFVCLDEYGTLRLIKATPAKYEVVAEAMMKGQDGLPLFKYPAWAAPILSEGRLFVRGKDRLVCLQLMK